MRMKGGLFMIQLETQIHLYIYTVPFKSSTRELTD